MPAPIGAPLEHAGVEHFPQERREWIIQAAAWTVMALILVAALLGAFGNGPLSKRVIESDPPGLRVEYQKIIRHQAQAELKLRVESPSSEEVVLTIGEGYFQHFELESVVPEPKEQRSGDGRLVLVMLPVRAGEAFDVTLRAKVAKLGSIPGAVSLDVPGGVPRRVRIDQFALP